MRGPSAKSRLEFKLQLVRAAGTLKRELQQNVIRRSRRHLESLGTERMFCKLLIVGGHVGLNVPWKFQFARFGLFRPMKFGLTLLIEICYKPTARLRVVG
jgi:hypothetical protein